VPFDLLVYIKKKRKVALINENMSKKGEREWEKS